MCLLRGTDWVFIYNSTFCPHSVFMCFVWIWEQTAIISLYSIRWLVFITETESVYCAVRMESIFNTLPCLRGLVPCLSPQRPSFDYRPSRVIFWWAKCRWDRFSTEWFGFPLPLPLHHCSIIIFVYALLLTEEQTDEVWKRSNKQCFFGKRKALVEKYFNFFVSI